MIGAFDVQHIYMPKKEHMSKTFENLLDTIEAKGLTIHTAKAGKIIFDYGNLKAELLAPNSEYYSNLNNYSAVLLLIYNEKRFLFMGDAEREVEEEILAREYDVSADVLKVGHHGSDTSSTKRFIEAVKPSYAVISVGANNPYGHPASATLDLLQNMKAEIWRTDDKGTVVVVSNGENLTISHMETFVQPNAPPVSSSTNLAQETERPEDKNVTVYITQSGTKYHRDGCRYLSKSKIPVALNELDTKKYAPCLVCKPAAQK